MDNYPDLPTRAEMLTYMHVVETDEAAAKLLDGYTARVIAEHRDAEQGCCHCGIPGKHHTSDHKAQPPHCSSVAPSISAGRCARYEGHLGLHRNSDAEEWS